MSFFTQTRFPFLWNAFQHVVGGTIDKRKLATLFFSNRKRVLEVGCSLGNIAMAFRDKNCSYLGIDIDEVAINYAQKTFASYSHMEFKCMDFRNFNEEVASFDYILFPGVCHHVNDGLLKQLIKKALGMLSPEGILVVIDPVSPEETSSWLVKRFIKIDKGEFIRSEWQLLSLLQDIPDMELCHSSKHMVGATPYGWPIVAEFLVSTFVRKR